MTQTVTALYDSYDDAASAVKALEQAGIPHNDISIVASNAEDSWTSKYGPTADRTTTATGTGAGTGAILGGGAGLLAGLGLLAIPGLGPVVAAGWLAATATGAAAGAVAGGLIGSLTGAGVSEEHAHVYAEGVRRGGSLVTVRASDDKAAAARQILSGGNAVDPVSRRKDYTSQGWSQFDASAAPYTREEIERERNRYQGRSI